MKAIWYKENGPAREVLKFGELNKPEPQLNEVLIRVMFSGVNPSDVKRRQGQSASFAKQPMVIPHNDGSGVIEAVGEGVSPARIGERVWIYEAALSKPFGTAAEYVSISQNLAVAMPAHTSFELGASLGVPAMTAHRCLFSNGPISEKTILVTGGAGSVGNYVIQLAKWSGARVFSTVSSEEKAQIARKAGADRVINYKDENVADIVLDETGGLGVDRIVEVALGANLMQDIKALKPEGTIVAYSSDAVREPVFPFNKLFSKNPTYQFVLVYTMSKQAHAQAVSDINECLEKKALTPNIGKIFPLEETASAHEAVENGSITGKILAKPQSI